MPKRPLTEAQRLARNAAARKRYAAKHRHAPKAMSLAEMRPQRPAPAPARAVPSLNLTGVGRSHVPAASVQEARKAVTHKRRRGGANKRYWKERGSSTRPIVTQLKGYHGPNRLHIYGEPGEHKPPRRKPLSFNVIPGTAAGRAAFFA